MRKGFNPQLFLDSAGAIFAIATGSDMCAEQEVGSQPMQDALCSGRAAQSDSQVIAELRAGTLKQYPQLIARKTIDKNIQNIQLFEGVEKDGRPHAALVYRRRSSPEMPLYALQELECYKDELAGAWDDESFGFKVVGTELVPKLKAFYAALLRGEGIFAGTFLRKDAFRKATGVMIALQPLLQPEHLAGVAAAQAEYEASMRLKAQSRVEELHAVARAEGQPKHVVLPGHIWPVWRCGPDSEVVYAVNPDYMHRRLGFHGYYSFDALKTWILAEKKEPLTSLSREVAAV